MAGAPAGKDKKKKKSNTRRVASGERFWVLVIFTHDCAMRRRLRAAPVSALGESEAKKKKETSNQFLLQARVSGLPSNVRSCVATVCAGQNSIESCKYQTLWHIDQQLRLDLHVRRGTKTEFCTLVQRLEIKFYLDSWGSTSCTKTDTRSCNSDFLFCLVFFFFWWYFFHDANPVTFSTCCSRRLIWFDFPHQEGN